ncbi:MAG: nitroreductase family protein [Eggerthellaceae bacterium]
MDVFEVMEQRHSVRKYLDKPISSDAERKLRKAVEEVNAKSGLSIQLMLNEPMCFASRMARYGKFSGVKNYISLVGPKGDSLDEACGYWGEHLVLLAQEMGLNTCWVALSHGRSAAKVARGQKEVCLIAVGYGANQGFKHRVKTLSQLTDLEDPIPDWFMEGLYAAQLAPTAMNQQKFVFSLVDGEPAAQVCGHGFYSKVDLGIVKYHFEAATGRKVR